MTTYDILGRVDLVTPPDGNASDYQYLDLKTKVIDALDNATTTHYDEWGRVVKVDAAVNPDVEYFYDAADRLTQVARGGANTILTYDYAGRKLRWTTRTWENGTTSTSRWAT